MKIWLLGSFLLFANVVCSSQSSSSKTQHIGQLIAPQQLASELQAASKPPLIIVFAGFPVLYKGGHIPHAILAGPASKPEGLNALRSLASKWSRNTRIVVYCGCCPFGKCPNVAPAYRLLRQLGFQRIQTLQLETNFHTDWAAHGYAVEKG